MNLGFKTPQLKHKGFRISESLPELTSDWVKHAITIVCVDQSRDVVPSYYNKKQNCLSRVVMVTDKKPQILNCNIQFYFK